MIWCDPGTQLEGYSTANAESLILGMNDSTASVLCGSLRTCRAALQCVSSKTDLKTLIGCVGSVKYQSSPPRYACFPHQGEELQGRPVASHLI